jgi:hypothetical protein
MLIQETEAVLASMLDGAGVHWSAANPRTTVEVFRIFAALPVEGVAPPDNDGDGVLAEFGMYKFRGQYEFSTGFTRQFIEDDEPDPPMWQVSCTLHWPPNLENALLDAGELWSFDKTLDEFFEEAVALPGWAWALERERTPGDLELLFTQI